MANRFRLSVLAAILVPLFARELAAGQQAPAEQFLAPAGQSTSDRGDPVSRLELQISEKSSQAAIDLAFQHSWAYLGVAHFSSLDFGLSAPAGNDASVVSLGTLDGLANAATFNLKISDFHVPIGGVNSADEKAMFAICEDPVQGLDAAYKKMNGSPPADPLECEAGNVAQYLPAKLEQFTQLLWKSDAVWWRWGAVGRIGTKKFDFVNTGDLAAASVHRMPWSLEAFFGLFPGVKNRFLITVGSQYQEAFMDEKSGVACLSTADGAAPKCASGPLGAPSNMREELLYAEVRSRLRMISDGAAFTFRATYDFENHNKGLDAPIYLLSDSDTKLAGGVRLGWTNKSGFTAGVFAGKSFSFFQ